MPLKHWLMTKIHNAMGARAITDTVRIYLDDRMTNLSARLDHMTALMEHAAGVPTHPNNQRRDLMSQSNAQMSDVRQSIGAADSTKQVIGRVLDRCIAGSAFTCSINHIDMVVPVEMLEGFRHCLHPHPNQPLTYLIETQQSDWLTRQITEGDVALDIGAHIGVISLPMARVVGAKGHVYAFEPARQTAELLTKILELNGAKNISVVRMALSDEKGTAMFVEYHDERGQPLSSIGSALDTELKIRRFQNFTEYEVEITTVDSFVPQIPVPPACFKIDVEGFELYVLRGARETLRAYRPSLCIDIHNDARTGKWSLPSVQEYLDQFNYRYEVLAKRILCARRR
jgi:FkbM family methyltransferase